ncbi:hypothetical protein K2173_015764 [Erythroxylum novogranatense]|uniref:Cupin type-1 domain-containing protein n=1 Tax=Erythroxylum novogranatense TaxID=1862640 RepID=A0AAV8THV3_9ROSI|nr:hypothetical protein K2173_015764 [Erythroxylum novogranatense]
MYEQCRSNSDEGNSIKKEEKKENSLAEVRTKENPYYFQSQKFRSSYKSQEGHLKILEWFSKRSKLLRGLDNYHLAVFEASPNTFSVPHHCDVEVVFVVLKGKRTITFLLRGKRESYNVESYDVIGVPAGTTVYSINLCIILSQGYFAGGGDNPESFYRAFSNDILETALKTPKDRLDRFFGQQKKGFVLKASREQIKALSEHAFFSTKQRGHEWRGPFSLRNQQSIYSNNHGKFFGASPDDCKQLQDINLSGALMVPHYNSWTTIVVLVVEGRGRFEMACPHLERQRHDPNSGRYQKISSQLSPGDVFIIPAGHPVAVLASENENLRTLGFGINVVASGPIASILTCGAHCPI